ncbi:oligosaccharide flippase family protein [Raoultella planticola]|uniref:oligosaccharide flippase family protein n=1 Tax=Raoultella planticola TaxID=575 RepID=UPI00388E95AC
MSKNSLIVKNTLFLATRTIVSVIISFYTTRVILHQLGAQDYGLFSVIYGIVGFTVFLSSAMNESVQRFISMNLGVNNLNRLKDIVKNSLISYLFLSLLFIVILISFRDYVITSFLNIPTESLIISEKLYIIAVCAIAISILQTPFNALVIAHENMSFYAYMSIFDVFSKLIISILISQVNEDKVLVYAILLFLSSLLVFFIYISYCLKRFWYSFSGGLLSFAVIKEISSFSFWNVFGNFAFVCRTQGINIIINLFFATTVNAAYALSNAVLNALTSLTQAFVMSVRPQIFKAYADDNTVRYTQLVTMGSKFTFSLLFLISAPLLIYTDQILSLWLVDTPDYTVSFIRFVLVAALIDSFSSSIIAGIQATGKIKIYQLVVSFFVFISLPISYVLYSYGFSVYTAFIPIISFSILNLNMRLYFLSRNTSFNISRYYLDVIFPCLTSVVISLFINLLIKKYSSYNTVLEMLICLTICFFVTLVILFFITTSMVERKNIFDYVLRKLK